jgi:hypothetical protein
MNASLLMLRLDSKDVDLVIGMRKVAFMKTKMVFQRMLCMLAVLSLLSGCATTPSVVTATSTLSRTTGGLSVASQLLVGIYRLEDTANAVDADTAAALIPLWQVYRELMTNSVAASAEIDSVTDQIQSTLTPAQINAIQAMSLSQQDLATLINQSGLASQPSTAGNAAAQGDGATANAGSPGAGGPTGMAEISGDSNLGSSSGTSSQKSVATQRLSVLSKNATSLSTDLLDALISFLQKRAGI